MTSNQQGFTLTEMVVTVAITGLLATAAYVRVSRDVMSVNAMPNVLAGLHQRAARVLASSTATPADAIALGYPPDVRGRLIIVARACSQASAADKQAMGFPLISPPGESCGYYESRFEAIERYEKGPQFSVIAKSFLPMFQELGESPTSVWRTEGAAMAVGSQNCTADGLCPSGPGTADTPFLNGNMINDEEREILCYANSTCDPVTYWFKYGGARGAGGVGAEHARLIVFPTGGLLAIHSWRAQGQASEPPKGNTPKGK